MGKVQQDPNKSFFSTYQRSADGYLGHSGDARQPKRTPYTVGLGSRALPLILIIVLSITALTAISINAHATEVPTPALAYNFSSQNATYVNNSNPGVFWPLPKTGTTANAWFNGATIQNFSAPDKLSSSASIALPS